jgi:hypothetical protein
VLLPVAARPAEDAADLVALRRKANDLVTKGRVAQAAVVSERARALAERRLEELAETFGDLALLYLKLGREGDAEILSGRALTIYDGSSARPGGNLWHIMRLLAEAYTMQGRTADAATALARVRAIEQAISEPFEVELAVAPDSEFITTDLKRLRLRDCGVVSFRVDDAHALLSMYDSFARVQDRIRLEIGSALRSSVGARSSAQVRDEADQIDREFSALLNKFTFGYSVRVAPANIASCLVKVELIQ